MDDIAFRFVQNDNEFCTIEGSSYHLSIEYVDGYYLSSAIASTEMYYSRLYVTLWTVLLSFLFITIGSGFFTTSDDMLDASYRTDIIIEAKVLSLLHRFSYRNSAGKTVYLSASKKHINRILVQAAPYAKT